MFSSSVTTTRSTRYARAALTIGSYIACILFAPLLLQEKYSQRCTYLLPAVALLTWGALSITNYRNYTPIHVQARWDGAVWLAATTLYILLHLTAAPSGLCILFTIFGAPAAALTASYIAVGRFYSERLAKEESIPHLRAINTENDAALYTRLKNIGAHALEAILLVTIMFAIIFLLHDTMKLVGRGNSDADVIHWFRSAIPQTLLCYCAGRLNGAIQKYKVE